MRFAVRRLLAAAVSVAAIVSLAGPAAAKCTRLAFEVNDYGKDGPTRDAKSLLDKYIATWTAERGIKKYNVGKKDVTCELFLNLIVFDEHTCKAAATVCWSEGGPATTAAVTPAAAPAAAATTPATPAAAKAKPKPKVPAPAAAGAVSAAPAKQ